MGRARLAHGRSETFFCYPLDNTTREAYRYIMHKQTGYTVTGTQYQISTDRVQSGAVTITARIELGSHVFVRTIYASGSKQWEVYQTRKGIESFLGYAPEHTARILDERCYRHTHPTCNVSARLPAWF